MIYCRLFCFVSEIQEMLIKHFELEYFYYYNGGDTPEYFTQDEWDFRESIWCEYEPFFISDKTRVIGMNLSYILLLKMYAP